MKLKIVIRNCENDTKMQVCFSDIDPQSVEQFSEFFFDRKLTEKERNADGLIQNVKTPTFQAAKELFKIFYALEEQENKNIDPRVRKIMEILSEGIPLEILDTEKLMQKAEIFLSRLDAVDPLNGYYAQHNRFRRC